MKKLRTPNTPHIDTSTDHEFVTKGYFRVALAEFRVEFGREIREDVQQVLVEFRASFRAEIQEMVRYEITKALDKAVSDLAQVLRSTFDNVYHEQKTHARRLDDHQSRILALEDN